jgi:glycine oxidase
MAGKGDVLIVGGGVIGCAIAYYLGKAGVRATVLERGAVGSQASSVAAGMLAPLAESHGKDANLELGLRSLAMFPQLSQELMEEAGVDIEYAPKGILRVAVSEEEEGILRERIAWGEELGVEVEWLPGEEARRLEPALSPEIRGALHSPKEAQVSSPHLTEALAQAAARRGARFRQNSEVVGFLKEGSRIRGVRLADGRLEGDVVVVAAGAWSGNLGQWLGISIPVRPIRGQIFALKQLPTPVTRMIFGNGYIAPKGDGTLLVGSTQEEAGFDSRPTAEGVADVLGRVLAMVPALRGATFCQAWAGLRPGSPDNLPILGPVEGLEGLILATGHFRNGILLAPITGKFIAELIAEGREEPLKPFSPSRLQKGPRG